MGTLNKKISAAGLLTIEHDFNDGEGPTTIHVKPLSFNDRAKLFTARLVGNEGKGIYGGTPETGLYFDAELLAATLCDDKGKPEATLTQILEWPGTVVYELARKVFALEFPDTKTAPNPSPAASQFGTRCRCTGGSRSGT